jgi:phosphoribosylformimino-5-aminoimidazole carboxamide ribonucleotide (ProFAR) isomerase
MKCRVVPAIDLMDGRCVRLRGGDFATAEVVGAGIRKASRRRS